MKTGYHPPGVLAREDGHLRLSAWLIAAVLMLPVGVVSANVLIRPAIPEQLVEGHTVFLTIEAYPNATREERFAAAVAVLVQERTHTEVKSRFPGVLWSNDQYLVDPMQDTDRNTRNRYPCTGAVIAVNRGDPVDRDPAGKWTLINATYLNESYLITDPTDHQWDIDLWLTRFGTYAWTVALNNDPAGYGIPDNNARCNGREASSSLLEQRQDPGEHGIDHPCDGCRDLKWNALLYFRLEHLRFANASKDHRENVGPDWWQDAAACHDSYTNQWTCPADDDDREGNSHPYNPDLPYPLATYDGYKNHGGSDTCDATGILQQDCHATRDVDIYYGYVMEPPVVRRWAVFDVVGSAAPYHCHDTNDFCGPDALSGPPVAAP